MPDLPTITVTQPQADRMLAAYSGQFDEQGVPMTPTQAYKRWLKSKVIEFVLGEESRVIEIEYSKKDAKLQTLRSDLGG